MPRRGVARDLLLIWIVLPSAGVVAPRAPAPCASSYSAWLGEPSAFVRNDEPRKLQGLHVVCLWQGSPYMQEDNSDGIQMEAFPNAVTSLTPIRTSLPGAALESWKDFRKALRDALKFTKKSNDWGFLHLKQPFGIFSADGKRLASATQALETGLVFVIEGGQWFWPPIKEGYLRRLPGTNLELETISVQPVAFRVRGFLLEEEVSEIVKLGKPRMYNSPVSLMDKDKGKEAKEFRTSTQARIGRSASKVLQAIDDRVANLTRIAVYHNEDVQILRYEKKQYYSAHLDNWDPQFYTQSDSSFMQHGHQNRLLTVFWYLSNVSKGGHTLFPRALGLPQPRDMWACDKGLKVQPEQGAVILWYSLHPNGNTDRNGLHAACPVESDETKWAANYWVWNKPRDGRPMPDRGVDDDDDEATLPEVRPSARDPVTVTFENPGEKEVHLFWHNADKKEDVFMGTMQPQGQLSMNSFQGHKWHVRAGATPSSRLLMEQILSSSMTQTYKVQAATSRRASRTDSGEL